MGPRPRRVPVVQTTVSCESRQADQPPGSWMSQEASGVVFQRFHGQRLVRYVFSYFVVRRIWVLVTGLLLAGAYRRRVRQIALAMDAGFNERLAERTRIARELHDTLLQSFQGCLFEFQAGRNLLSRRPEEAARTIDEAIRSAEAATVAGRDAIQDLRAGSEVRGDLADLYTAAGRELWNAQASNDNAPEFRVTVEGSPETLSPASPGQTLPAGKGDPAQRISPCARQTNRSRDSVQC